MADAPQPRQLAVVILAAGKGTRMKNPDIAKVMYPIEGKPMVAYVVELAAKIGAGRILLVVGWRKETVTEYFAGGPASITFVAQDDQLGTGHAVQQTESALAEFSGDVLVLSGDVPLLTEKTLRALLGYHRTTGAAATILTAEVEDASGYGRVVRNKDESVRRIVEDKDATSLEKKITEINSGIYVFEKEKLFEAISAVTPDNAQGEYYLTDVFEILSKKGWRISAVKCLDPAEVAGINDLAQLESARGVMVGRAGGAG
jgi:UDP-N-acetylglucosamine diphosphorylase/glucosamine-1-phosphate N-acetyltransferase